MAWDWRFKGGDDSFKKRFGKTTVFFMLAIMLIGGYSFFHHAPLQMQAKPEPAPQKTYAYYIIIDKETDALLMYVPVTVRTGDELISEDNNRYVVVEVIDDVAYARFIEKIR